MANAPKSSGRAVSPFQLLTLLIAFLLIAGAGGLLVAGMLLPAVASVGTASNASTELFNDLPTELEIDEPSQQSVILDADGNTLATFFAENREVVGHDDLSEHVRNAVVAVEDHRFYDHTGVDVEGIARAVARNASGDELQGASTLTQQYVKNVLIEQGRVANDPEQIAEATETTMGRKLREARYAIALEQQVSKEDILTGYLNIAQFGPSQYGAETAAQHYFNKPASDLNIGESAVLAGITQSPGKWDPVRNPEDAQRRRDVVLGLMEDQGYITQEEHEEALEVDIEDMLDVTDMQRGCGAAGNAAYFCQYVVHEILDNDAYGETMDERRQLLNRGGLEIQTTLDPDTQDAAYDSVTDTVPVNDGSGISMALSSVEPGTGNIQAMAQNSHYGTATEDDPGATQVNFNVGRSHGGGSGFQSGSTFKVYTLIEWLRTGHHLSDVIDTDNRSFPRESWDISCAPEMADDYSPMNLEGIGGGHETVMESTRMSINIPFVAMANQMDLCDIRDVAQSTGLYQGNGEELQMWPSMVLGANTVPPLGMANSFATLAARGTYCEPRAITGIVDAQGNDMEVPEPNCEDRLDTDVVDAVNHALQAVVQDGGTGTDADLSDRPAAGKTGTANDDKHAWFVGYVPQMASAVWMGHPHEDIPMVDVTIDGQWYERMYGGLLAAPTWHAYMEQATDGMSVEEFHDADDEIVHGEQAEVPDVEGRSVDEATSALEGAGFSVTVGSESSSDHPAGTVASTSPSAGSEADPGDTVTIHPSSSGGSSNDSDSSDDDGDDGDSDDGARGRGHHGQGEGHGQGHGPWHGDGPGEGPDNRAGSGNGHGGGPGNGHGHGDGRSNGEGNGLGWAGREENG